MSSNVAATEDVSPCCGSSGKTRVFAGQEFGLVSQREARVDGVQVADEDGWPHLAAVAGVDRALWRSVSALALVRVGPAYPNWASLREEEHYRFDLALGPGAMVLFPNRPRHRIRVHVPFGPSWTSGGSWEGRLVTQEASPRIGWNAAVLAGVDLARCRHGVFFDIGAAMHMTSYRLISRLEGSSAGSTQQIYRSTDLSLFFTVGYAFLP